MSFIQEQQQIADEYFRGEPNKARAKIIAKQTIINTVNHLLAGVEDIDVGEGTYCNTCKQHIAAGDCQCATINYANAKIRQRCTDIISEVSE